MAFINPRSSLLIRGATVSILSIDLLDFTIYFSRTYPFSPQTPPFSYLSCKLHFCVIALRIISIIIVSIRFPPVKLPMQQIIFASFLSMATLTVKLPMQQIIVTKHREKQGISTSYSLFFYLTKNFKLCQIA